MHEHIYTDLATLTDELTAFTNNLPPLSALVDGRGLACPLPLLKAKLALKAMSTGTLYVIASDKNSQTDLAHFCQKNNLSIQTWQTVSETGELFHFLIQKSA